MRDKLKPCPFCGSNNLQSREGLEWSDVRCKTCLQSVSSFPCAAENVWNTRPIEDALESELDQLRKDNQALVEQVNVVGRKLENAIEILGDLGIRNCPMLTVNGYDCSNGKGCKHYHENTPTDTYACWTEYFKKGDKP